LRLGSISGVKASQQILIKATSNTNLVLSIVGIQKRERAAICYRHHPAMEFISLHCRVEQPTESNDRNSGLLGAAAQLAFQQINHFRRLPNWYAAMPVSIPRQSRGL
jgi:hypothetical protein